MCMHQAQPRILAFRQDFFMEDKLEAIIFIGIQASGKSTFYKQRFFNSHVRISLDLLNTRNKQNIFLETCFSTHSRFVVDNTNPTRREREIIITKAKENKYRVIGYYFNSSVEDALHRNNQRTGKEKIPKLGILGCYKRLELPQYAEGYDELYDVKVDRNEFIINILNE